MVNFHHQKRAALERLLHDGETTMNHLMNLLDGFASVLGNYLSPGRSYVRYRKSSGFTADQARLRGDAHRVTADIRKSISSHGNQSSTGKGKKPQR